ncbi:MAG: 30S ribosomal protein S2 [Candidatus Andersenbacteria bacterium]
MTGSLRSRQRRRIKGMPITIPSLKELLQSGAHFGQKTSRWHPKAKPFLFGSAKGVHIINLEKTREQLAQAAEFALNLSRRGGTILFVGTKRQARGVIEAAATKAGMPHITGRWMGGLFTNFNTMLDLLRKLERLEADKAAGKFAQYTKREQLDVERDIARLHGTIGGIKDVRRLPDAVFIADVTVDKIAVGESTRKGIPIIAIVDSNANPEPIAYPIPANDDAVKSVELISNVIADAILEGKKLTPAPATAPAPEPQAA